MRRQRRSQRGSAIVEFALGFSLIAPVFLATFEFGYAFYLSNLLKTQVRDGARYASMRQFRAQTTTSVNKYKAAVRNMVRFSTPDGSGALIIPGLLDSHVIVSITDSAGVEADSTHVPAGVSVTIRNFNLNAGVATLNFSDKVYLKFPYAGRYAPGESEP